MKKILLIIMIFGANFILTGCETTSSRPYSASTDNVLRFQSILSESGSKVKLNDFSESKDIGSLTCRLSGPVDVSPGKPKSAYIQEALKTELFMAQAYDVNAEVTINGHLESLNFSSVSPAKWDITFTVSSNKSDGYTVTTSYPFKTSFSAYSACKNVADAFGPAIQQLNSDIVNHPGFSELVGQ